MKDEQRGARLVVGAIGTYLLFQAWRAGWFDVWSINYLTFAGYELPQSSDVMGGPIADAIAIISFIIYSVGTVLIWVGVFLWNFLSSLLMNIRKRAGGASSWVDLITSHTKQDPTATPQPTSLSPEQQAEAERKLQLGTELVAAAIAGSRDRTIRAAHALHGSAFFLSNSTNPSTKPEQKAAVN